MRTNIIPSYLLGNEQHPQAATPYATALLQRAEELTVRGQAPGHAGHLPQEFAPFFGDHYGYVDLSVVKGLDVALGGQPTPLSLAEQLAAEAVGASAASFFTNGATAAASALTSALVEVARGRTILVARNAHVSVIHTLMAAGARVEFLPVEMHPVLGMATVLDPALLAATIAANDIGAVWVSTPNYEGVLGDIAAYVRVCHDREAPIPIVVDNSWASEMPFSDLLGASPLALGADAVVGSPHKTLRVPGQGAWAFRGKGSLIPADTFRIHGLRHKTTSKSSNFLAGLDLCRRWAYFNTDAGIRANLEVLEAYGPTLPEGTLVDWDVERHEGRTIAPRSIGYRMTISTWQLGYTGFEVAERLRERGVQVAQPNVRYLFVGTGVGNPDVVRALLEEVRTVLRQLPRAAALEAAQLPELTLTQATVDFGELQGVAYDTVPLREAVGRRLGDPIGAYPPGLAILTPGEVLDAGTAEYLMKVRAEGGTIYGGDPVANAAGRVRVVA